MTFPAATAALFALILCLRIGHYHWAMGLLILTSYVVVGLIIPAEKAETKKIFAARRFSAPCGRIFTIFPNGPFLPRTDPDEERSGLPPASPGPEWNGG